MGLKQQLQDILIKRLEQEIDRQLEIVRQSQSAVTQGDVKQESKYDTRAIEAGYLAGAQAVRLDELKRDLNNLKQLFMVQAPSLEQAASGALIRLENSDQTEEMVFLVPCRGGDPIVVDGQTVQIISTLSAMGKEMIGLSKGDSFEIRVGTSDREFIILNIY